MKKVDFLFVYEVRNREIDSICLLGAYLEIKGYTVAYINSWDSLYILPEDITAKVVVLSAAYNNGTYKYFTSRAKSFQKAINLQWEQVLTNYVRYSKEKTSWDYSGVALHTRHICWGEDNKEYLQRKFGVNEKYLKVCGYLPLDFYREEFKPTTIDRESLYNHYGLDVNKKTILFVSSFSVIGLPKSEEAMNTEERRMNEKKIHWESQAIIMEWFEQFAHNYPSYQIVYRPHPAEAKNQKLISKTKEIENFYVIQDESIRNWIQNCDIICNWMSTSMIEMYASGKKTILMRPVHIPHELDMDIFTKGDCESVNTYEHFCQAVFDEKQEYSFPINKQDLLYYYDIQEEPVYRRIGNYLIETFNNPDYTSENIIRRPRVIKGLNVRVVRILTTGTGILQKILLHGEENTEEPINKYGFFKTFLINKYSKYKYFKQKWMQNRITEEELRDKIESFKTIIVNSSDGFH